MPHITLLVGITIQEIGDFNGNIMMIIYIYILAAGFKHDCYFPFSIWVVILPVDFHIFQDGSNHQPDYITRVYPTYHWVIFG
jgi:hypothetical protein